MHWLIKLASTILSVIATSTKEWPNQPLTFLCKENWAFTSTSINFQRHRQGNFALHFWLLKTGNTRLSEKPITPLLNLSWMPAITISLIVLSLKFCTTRFLPPICKMASSLPSSHIDPHAYTFSGVVTINLVQNSPTPYSIIIQTSIRWLDCTTTIPRHPPRATSSLPHLWEVWSVSGHGSCLNFLQLVSKAIRTHFLST